MKKPIYYFVWHSEKRRYETLGWVFDHEPEYPDMAVGSIYRWAGIGEPEHPSEDFISDLEREERLKAFDAIWPDPVGGDGQ